MQDKPVDPEHYSLKRLSADLASLLDVIGVQKAVSLYTSPKLFTQECPYTGRYWA